MALQITSEAFGADAFIPSKHTCEGDNVSPALSWEQAPKNVVSFVLIVDDPDAPSKTWTHWVMYDIPPTVTGCKEGTVPSGALQGVNDFGEIGYGGPCPPSGIHRYFFKLYALDKLLGIPQGASKQQVEKAIEGHILAEAQLIGRYQKKSKK